MDFPGFSVRQGFVGGSNSGGENYPISKDVRPVYKTDTRQERPYERSQYGRQERLFVSQEDSVLASSRLSFDRTVLYNSRAQIVEVPQDRSSYSWAA